MKILALDLGTHTGWAFSDRIGCEHGAEDFSFKRGESAGMLFVKFRAWLTRMIVTLKPTLVLYEQAHHQGGAATEILVGLTTRVGEICEEINDKYKVKIEYKGIHSSTIKADIAGSGRANKADMIAVAEKICGGPIKSDDEADAICLLEYGRRTFMGTKDPEYI